MSEIELFTFKDHQVRTLVMGGEPWFLAVDVCAICGLRDTSSALRKVDDRDVRRLRRSDTPQFFRGIAPQVQEIAVVNESGMYDLVFQSTKQDARDFKRWVTSDLLPRYRRGELTAAPRELTRLELIDLARDAEVGRLAEAQRRELAEQRTAELEPSAYRWDTLVDTDGDYLVGDAAKFLRNDRGVDTGPQRLFEQLQTLGWIFRTTEHSRWRAKQAAIETGRLRERIVTRPDPDTGKRVAAPPQVRVTFKGIEDLHKALTAGQAIARRDGAA